ncbi:unnamed protein product [[Candida] boidinii]|nr:unnamed protein product [[Candida] boidinii]
MVKLQYQENPDDNSTEDTDKGKSGTIDTEDNTNNTNIKTIARELSLINLKSNYNNNNSNKNLDSKYMIVPKESILNSTKCLNTENESMSAANSLRRSRISPPLGISRSRSDSGQKNGKPELVRQEGTFYLRNILTERESAAINWLLPESLLNCNPWYRKKPRGRETSAVSFAWNPPAAQRGLRKTKSPATAIT